MMMLMTGLFIVTMAFNVVALVRHYNTMWALRVVMINLVETQKQFLELKRAQELPEPERADAIRAIVEKYVEH